jgi:hypothetical protein
MTHTLVVWAFDVYGAAEALTERASLFSNRSLGLIRAIGFRPEKIRSGLPFLMRAIASFILYLLSV